MIYVSMYVSVYIYVLTKVTIVLPLQMYNHGSCQYCSILFLLWTPVLANVRVCRKPCFPAKYRYKSFNICVCVCVKEREREGEREGEKEKEREKKRKRERERDREKEREKERERERERERQREREREIEKEREKELFLPSFLLIAGFRRGPPLGCWGRRSLEALGSAGRVCFPPQRPRDNLFPNVISSEEGWVQLSSSMHFSVSHIFAFCIRFSVLMYSALVM